ncbi:NADH dehydrogenase [ubiquinone] 1 alpha subcomplex subunit 13 [Ixodes scapularis]
MSFEVEDDSASEPEAATVYFGQEHDDFDDEPNNFVVVSTMVRVRQWSKLQLRYLKQLKKNFEEEKRVMKNVPGWKVGTYYGEPLYKTMSPNYHVDPPMEEYYAHTDPKKSDYAWFYWYNHF